jgi:hypothetical protein
MDVTGWRALPHQIQVTHSQTGRVLTVTLIARSVRPKVMIKVLVGLTEVELYPNRLGTAFYGEVGARTQYRGALVSGNREIVYARSVDQVSFDVERDEILLDATKLSHAWGARVR